jgi:hypothetical protein
MSLTCLVCREKIAFVEPHHHITHITEMLISESQLAAAPDERQVSDSSATRVASPWYPPAATSVDPLPPRLPGLHYIYGWKMGSF